MRRSLQDARVLLTGATGGLGTALAHALSRRGARLLLTGRNQDALRQLAAQLQGRTETHVLRADLTNPEDRNALIQSAADRFGALDVLINNAGLGARGLFENSDPEVLRKLMEVNFFAPAELIRASLPLLARGRQPIVVNIGSASGRRGFPVRAEYAASKFALAGLSEVLAAELSIHNIDVLLVSSGHIATEFFRHFVANTTQAGRTGQMHSRGVPPDVAADKIVRAIERGKRELVFPFKIWLTLLVNRLFPRILDYFAARHCRKHYAAESRLRQECGSPQPIADSGGP